MSNHFEAWYFDLSSVIPKSFFDKLSEEDRARMERISHSESRRRFLAGRGLMREVLSFYEKTNQLDIRVDSLGKPFLMEAKVVKDFSLSHSEDAVVLAVSLMGKIGVDVELLGNTEQPDLKNWVKKEALGKLAGIGILQEEPEALSACSTFSFSLGAKSYAMALAHETSGNSETLLLRSYSAKGQSLLARSL